MKVTLDLTQLLAEGKISQAEHDKLAALSRTDTRSHAFAIVAVLAAVSIVAGTIGLFPEFFGSIAEQLLKIFGERGLHFAAVLGSGAAALLVGSGFLATLCAFILLTFLGNAGTFYTHATYFVAIEEPARTIVAFSALALAAHVASGYLPQKQRRVAIIFARASLFIVNLAFWIGSLWGDKTFGQPISELQFAVAWALALVGVGVWGAIVDKRWVVNTAAVFGSIHFYTQWFERLGATPGSLLFAGALGLAILFGLRAYNRTHRARPIAAQSTDKPA